MAEMAQQTPLVIEVVDIDNTEITTDEKTKIRRAVIRGNGLNIVLATPERKSKVLHYDVEGGIEIGNNVIISYYDPANSQITELDCGTITAEDFSDDTPADE